MDPAQLGKIYKALTLFLVTDTRPFSLVEGDGFATFMKTIDSRIPLPSRKVLKERYLPEIFLELKNDVRAIILENSLTCNITCDYWTCGVTNDAYLTVICHRITKNFEYYNFNLGTPCLNYSHTGELTADVLENILEEWGLLELEMITITTDKGANMVKGVALLA